MPAGTGVSEPAPSMARILVLSFMCATICPSEAMSQIAPMLGVLDALAAPKAVNFVPSERSTYPMVCGLPADVAQTLIPLKKAEFDAV